jgi:hypothetical protein
MAAREVAVAVQGEGHRAAVVGWQLHCRLRFETSAGDRAECLECPYKRLFLRRAGECRNNPTWYVAT